MNLINVLIAQVFIKLAENHIKEGKGVNFDFI